MTIITSEIASVIKGQLFGKSDLPVKELLTDSRLFNFTSESAFFAIKGPNHDGHTFVEQLYRKGIRIFIVENLPEDISIFQEGAFIKVESSVTALQDLASYKRRQYKGLVIGITGSSGKTIVKEWLADIMALAVPVIRSPKSYNSQIGVPLSVWKLEPSFQAGIFEAGISFPGEMKKIQAVIDPEIGVMTNIGDAHQENFPDLRAKADEKLKLFIDSKKIIYCRDHKLIHRILTENSNYNSKVLIGWSLEEQNADVFVKKENIPGGGSELMISYYGKCHKFTIPFSDRASVENAVTAAVVSLTAGISPSLISRGLSSLVAVAMRMELKSGINGCQLLEDYYNSDPGSLGMALEYLNSQTTRKRTLILSDFIQSGRGEEELYSGIGQLVNKAGIDRFIGIGKALMTNSSFFKTGSRFFHSTDEFVHNFIPNDFRNETILLKGARSFEFEKISRLLVQQVHQTVFETNLDAVSHNLNEFRHFLSGSTRIMAMVKAFAYGAGSAEIASLLEYHRIDYLAVAYADEGVELREAGVTLPVMVMNPESSAFEVMIRYNLEPEIFSLQLLKQFSEVASRHGLIDYPVHIKIDTGMHRLGFMPDESEELIKLLKLNECVRVASVFSHLAASEDPGFDDFTRKQADIFVRTASEIHKALDYPFLKHILNSSGIVRFPEYQFDMVRPGIGIYGVGKYNNLNLIPAGRFVTRVSQVKKIPAGEPVGYGCADVSSRNRVIAILPVGYADGLNRKLGNRNGEIFIKNRRVPVIGNVCMDMCMVDVTSLDIADGDEAEIFGTNIKVEEVADRCETIPYEILTSIPSRVKRVFFRQ